MFANEGETGFPVNIRDVVNDPGTGRMAPAAFWSYGLLVDVGMAILAFGRGILELQGRMTRFTVEQLMLAFQWQGSCFMIKRIDLPVEFPPFGGTVAYIATHFKIIAMR